MSSIKARFERLEAQQKAWASVAEVGGFPCPHCNHPITPHMRLSYPAVAIGRYTAVYRCGGCRRHVGEPMNKMLAADDEQVIRSERLQVDERTVT